MDSNETTLCLREALIKDNVLAVVLLAELNKCIPYAESLGFSKIENGKRINLVAEAYKVLFNSKDKLPKDENGKRYLSGEDETRDKICRLLFSIPRKNLIRKEVRELQTNPVESAAFDKHIQSQQPVYQQNTLRTRSVQSKPAESVPSHTVHKFEQPDKNAFESYVGNADAVRTVELQIEGALMRGDPIRPLLLRGTSGCGKTELGLRIAKRIGKPFYYVSGSTLKNAEDVDALFDLVEDRSILFVDETQASGDKAKARILTKQSKGEESGDKEVTFIFATNLSGKLPDAFRNRCVELKLHDYTINELMQISNQTAEENGVELAESVAKYISERCHGIARYAVDYTHDIIVENAADQSVVTLEHAKDFFVRRGIDNLGLKDEHRRYMRQLATLGQASSHSLAAALGENDVTEVEKSIEPLLLKHGLIAISSRGRYLTDCGQAYAQSLL